MSDSDGNDRDDKRDDEQSGQGQGSSDERGGDKADKDDRSGGDQSGDGKDGDDKSDDSDKSGDDDKSDEDKKKDSVFRKPLFWVILIAVISVLLIGGVLFWLHKRQYESTDDAFVDAHIVRLSAQSAGKLVAVADIDNRHVEAGRLLAIVEPIGPEAQLAETQADVRQAQAQYGQALAQISAAKATANQAEASARGPLASYAKAEADLARYQALVRLDPAAVSSQQVDAARETARTAASDAAAAQRNIDTQLANVAVARRNAKAAAAQIEARQAAVAQARVTYGDLHLRAPIAGQVVNRSVNVGSYVSAGTQLMAIVPDRVWVTANFKETQLTLMKIGQPVTIRVDAYPDVEFHGHVDSIQRGAGQAFALLPPQNATGNYVKVVQRVPVRIEFDHRQGDPDPRQYPIGPGMSVVPTVKVR